MIHPSRQMLNTNIQTLGSMCNKCLTLGRLLVTLLQTTLNYQDSLT